MGRREERMDHLQPGRGGKGHSQYVRGRFPEEHKARGYGGREGSSSRDRGGRC